MLKQVNSESLVEVSADFRVELVRSAQARIGQGFLDDNPRPDQWSTDTPFAYGLDSRKGGINCSGLVIAALADVLGRPPETVWDGRFRTSRAMVDLDRQSADYRLGATDFAQARPGDIIFTATEHIDRYGVKRQIGQHAMIVEQPLAEAASLAIIHADIDSGVARQSIVGQRGRIRLPLETLISHAVIDADRQTF